MPTLSYDKKEYGCDKKIENLPNINKTFIFPYIGLPNINANYQMHLLKDALINTLNKSSWAQKSRYKNMS